MEPTALYLYINGNCISSSSTLQTLLKLNTSTYPVPPWDPTFIAVNSSLHLLTDLKSSTANTMFPPSVYHAQILWKEVILKK